MKIENLKELEKVIKTCKRNGVTNIEIDGIKLVMSVEQQPYKAAQRLYAPTLDNDIPEARMKVPMFMPVPPGVPAPPDDMVLTPDSLSEDQLLFYSSASSNTEG